MRSARGAKSPGDQAVLDPRQELMDGEQGVQPQGVEPEPQQLEGMLALSAVIVIVG